ncbi:hypothetical protein DESA109040_01315 [Deinococcus saxicola]|uniref:hypothetical protein n=1 Tax=Deinococcus saxicola TaxID=249406 RepID=UPI0039F078BF
MTDPEPSFKLQELRENAEDQVRLVSPVPLWDGWPADALTYELQVHHAELAAQNEELQRTLVELRVNISFTVRSMNTRQRPISPWTNTRTS